MKSHLCDSRKYYRESNVLRAGARTNCTTVLYCIYEQSVGYMDLKAQMHDQEMLLCFDV